jgi:cytidine deaminase
MIIDRNTWKALSELAWKARDNAYILGDTKVGAAVCFDSDLIATGCNVEQIFRSHDIHAEVNAIGNMVAQGGKILKAVLIAAERINFTPCGACMDWIIQFGGGECEVAFQDCPGGDMQTFRAAELMPHYPH